MKLLPAQDEPISALRPFERAQLVVVDIDGTLIAQPDEDLFFQLEWLVGSLRHWSKSVQCTVATGRAWNGAYKYLGGLVRGGPATPVILYNGAVTVTCGGEILHSTRIAAGAAAAIAREATDAGGSVFAYDCNTVLGQDWPMERVVGWSSGSLPAAEFNGLPMESLLGGQVPPFDPVAMLVPARDPAVRRAVSVAATRTGEVTVTASSPIYLEVRPRGADKGAALTRLASRQGIDLRAVVAVGDNDNDEGLLRAAGVGVAVANASSSARAAADYMCRLPATAGVVELLRVLLEAKRYARAVHAEAL